MTLCVVEYINLTTKDIKIIGISSYNKQIRINENCMRLIIEIEKVLNLWQMGNLTI